MYIKLKRNMAISGEYVIYPVYEIDVEKMAMLTGYSLIESGALYTFNFDATEYFAMTFECSSAALYQYISNKIPLTPTADGNVIKRTMQFTYNDTESAYTESDFDKFEAVEIGVMPDDWGLNCDYFTSADWTTGGNTYKRFYPVPITASYNSSTQYYKYTGDIDKNPVQLFYCDNGNHFSFMRITGYSTTAKRVSFGRDRAGVWSQPYALSNDYSNLRYGNSGAYYDRTPTILYTESRTTTNLQTAYNGAQIFVHYTYNGVKYVGVAQLTFSAGAPSSISVSAFNVDFFGDNLISGGDTGLGEWGTVSTFHISDGTFTADSDTRGTGTATDATNIGQAINFALQNKLNSGYSVHRIDTSNDIAVNARNVKYFYKSLFSGNFLTRFLTAFYNPLSSIISCMLLPENLISSSGVSSTITASGYDIGAEMTTQAADDGTTVSGVYAELNAVTAYFVGSFSPDIYFGGYADFAPYTKCYLHLPYIGVQEIDINQIAHGKLSVTYVCDVITGNVSAWIWVNDINGICTYKYICTGNAGFTLKLAQNALNENPLSAFAGVSTAVAGIASGNAVMAIGGAIGAGSAIANAVKPSIQSAGQFSGDAGLISDSVCWIEFVRPQWVQPDNYQTVNGIPAGTGGTIRDNGSGLGYNGFLKLYDIDLDNVNATDFEKSEIKRLLQNGVYINAE